MSENASLLSANAVPPAVSPPPAAPGPFIFWDFTLSSGLRTPATGVVRTERRLTRYMLDRREPDVRFVVWNHLEFHLVPEADVAEWIADPGDAAPPPPEPPPPPKRPLREWLGLALKRIDQATTLKLWRAGRKIWRYFVPPPPPPPTYVDKLPICQFNAGDIYVLCAMILEPRHRNAVEKLRAQGIKVVILCYDIIAAVRPQYYAPKFGGELTNAFHRMIRLADFIPCISRCTERDLRAFAQAEGCTVATGVFELGCDGVATAVPDHGGHPVLSQLPEWGFVAMVGTFEVRKNHRLMLEVWQALAKVPGLELPPLVIAGMAGWCVDDVIEEMKRLPLYGKKIFWFSALSDRQVAWLFKHCAFSVYPSLYEGWGLPVAEGLSFSRPVLCANSSSLPEVAKGLATLLDPTDKPAWVAAVRDAIGRYAGQPVEIHYPRQTWEQTGREIYELIRRLQAPAVNPAAVRAPC